jgi:hypothetical protein
MRTIIPNLNYLHVLVVAVAGFMVGWIWYSFLFGKVWMKEMGITEEKMKQAAEKGMARYFAAGFACTFLSTFGLAALIAALHSPNWKHGAALGAFIGLFGPVMRMLNGSIWESKSVKLRVINAGHEVVMYALQGAILGAWH